MFLSVYQINYLLLKKNKLNYFFIGDGTVCTGGEKDRKLLTWDSAREFEKRLEIKLPDGVGSARSLTKQTIDQVSCDLKLLVLNTV